MANQELLSSFSKLDEAIMELAIKGISVECSIQKVPKQNYEVVISKTYTAVVPVKAISPSSAKAMVLEAMHEDKIKLDFICGPTDITVWDAADYE